MLKYLKSKFNSFRGSKTNSWKSNEYFDPNWKLRIKDMSQYIDSGSVVIDFGCGEMWLKEFITENELYIPVDYVSRGEGTIICDFNKYEFPKIDANIAFVSGCLEYIHDVNWFIEKISKSNNKCILSYCTTDFFSNTEIRKELAWQNHLSKSDIIILFENNNFFLVEENLTKTNNQIFVFKK